MFGISQSIIYCVGCKLLNLAFASSVLVFRFFRSSSTLIVATSKNVRHPGRTSFEAIRQLYEIKKARTH